MTIQISCFSEITGDREAGQMVQAAGLGEMRSNGEQKKLELRMEMALKGCQAAAKVIRWVGSEESGNP